LYNSTDDHDMGQRRAPDTFTCTIQDCGLDSDEEQIHSVF